MPELNRKHAAFGIAVIVLLLWGGSMLNISVYPATDYGIPEIWANGTKVTSTSTVYKATTSNLLVKLVDDPATSRIPNGEDFTAKLYKSDGTYVAEGTNKRLDGSDLLWDISLANVPTGTLKYYVQFYAFIDRDAIVRTNSFEFTITSEIAPSYDDVEITQYPETSFEVGETATLVWRFTYEGGCTAKISVNGVVMDTRNYDPSPVEHMFSYLINTDSAKSYSIVFTITPNVDSNPVVTDSKTILVVAPPPTTTTTTTTGTSTTTTTTDEPTQPVLDTTLQWILIAAVPIIFVLWWKSRD